MLSYWTISNQFHLEDKNVASCRVCGKKKTVGNNVSHANNKTKRQLLPNLQRMKVIVDGERELTASEGVGPVNALDGALRKALEPFYPELGEVQLVDFKVRVINAKEATAARVRVTIESSDRTQRWNTVGVSENIIEASWKALIDSIEYKLLKDRAPKPGRRKSSGGRKLKRKSAGGGRGRKPGRKSPRKSRRRR